MTFQAFIARIPLKNLMIGYLGLFLAFSSFAANSFPNLWKGLAIVLVYASLSALWRYHRTRTWRTPTSSIISGLILALVAVPSPPMLLIFVLPVLAFVSKHFIKFGRLRHVFNPAALALGAAAFLTPAISWWGVSWGRVPLVIAFIFGLLLLWRMKRFHIVVPFFAVYAFFLGILFLMNGVPVSGLPAFLWPQIFDGTVIFFGTVMLLDPTTSAFPTRENRIWYGALVGFFAVLVSWIGDTLRLQDPLIYGLLLGNLFCSLTFLPKRKIANS